jgi:hypothetical protein
MTEMTYVDTVSGYCGFCSYTVTLLCIRVKGKNSLIYACSYECLKRLVQKNNVSSLLEKQHYEKLFSFDMSNENILSCGCVSLIKDMSLLSLRGMNILSKICMRRNSGDDVRLSISAFAGFPNFRDTNDAKCCINEYNKFISYHKEYKEIQNLSYGKGYTDCPIDDDYKILNIESDHHHLKMKVDQRNGLSFIISLKPLDH